MQARPTHAHPISTKVQLEHVPHVLASIRVTEKTVLHVALLVVIISYQVMVVLVTVVQLDLHVVQTPSALA